MMEFYIEVIKFCPLYALTEELKAGMDELLSKSPEGRRIDTENFHFTITYNGVINETKLCPARHQYLIKLEEN